MQLKRLMALMMSIALALASYPSVRVAAQVPTRRSLSAAIQARVDISGTVVRSDRKTPVADACLRLRKMDTNAIVARTVSDRTGAFSFSVSEPGMYVVEVVDCGNGGVLAVSDALTLAQLPTHNARGAPHHRSRGFLSSTAFLVIAAASAAGITAIAVAGDEAFRHKAYRARSNSAA